MRPAATPPYAINYRINPLMRPIATLSLLIALSLLLLSCQEKANEDEPAPTFEAEKAAIIKTLNDETKAAFSRKYEEWQTKWVHEPYVSKTYMNFADSSLSESLGWEEISGFVRTYLEEHPTPAPLPKLIDEVELRLYSDGAWVNYEQVDSLLGLKRETRLLEKIDGQWKIAGMQTVIYGFGVD
ncbi:MAG: hypothetical protein AAGM67_16090 [Bacteroidota bacterium]